MSERSVSALMRWTAEQQMQAKPIMIDAKAVCQFILTKLISRSLFLSHSQ